MTPAPGAWLLDLCSGVGMLGLAVEMTLAEVLGWDVHPIAYCEMAEYPRRVLAARMADGFLKPAPILHDATRLPMSDLLGRVDVLCAGFPCPPVSVAGQQRGEDDERWLWPAVRDACGALRPGLIFLENVPGIVTANDGREFRSVIGDLASLGYAAEWGCLGSADVGASHGRERWWCLAYSHCLWQQQPQGGIGDKRGWPVDRGEGLCVRDLADPGGDMRDCGVSGGGWTARHPTAPACGGMGGGGLAHPNGAGWQGRSVLARERADELPAGPRDAEVGIYAWGPLDARWHDLRGHWAAFPVLRRMAVRMAHRPDRCRAAGNGVDPLAAGVAFALLGARAGLWRLG